MPGCKDNLARLRENRLYRCRVQLVPEKILGEQSWGRKRAAQSATKNPRQKMAGFLEGKHVRKIYAGVQ